MQHVMLSFQENNQDTIRSTLIFLYSYLLLIHVKIFFFNFKYKN